MNMINRINMFKVAKPYSPSFQAKGKITYEYEKIPVDAFEKSLQLPAKLQYCSEAQQELENFRVQLIYKLKQSGKLIQDRKDFLLKDKVTRVIVQEGDDEIPDDINIPNARIKVSNVKLRTINGKDVSLYGSAEVENVKAETLKTYGESKITGSAEVSQNAELLNESIAKDVKARSLTTLFDAQITGRADISDWIDIGGASRVKEVNAKEITLYDRAAVTGVASCIAFEDNRVAEFAKSHPVRLQGKN